MLSTTNNSMQRLAEVMPKAMSYSAVGDGAVLIVVDGLGWQNLISRRGHARFIASLDGGPIRTVTPSTTAAALATLTTGKDPLEHGFVGYRQRHSQHGLLTVLNDWDEITDVRDWQRRPTLFETGVTKGIKSFVVSKKQFAASGFTKAVLTGASFVSAETIAERFATARRLINEGQNRFIYIYVDELDAIGHRFGWQSDEWIIALESLDSEVNKFVTSLSDDTHLFLTADHGMVDVPEENHIDFEELGIPKEADPTAGGEPRFRHVYFPQGTDVQKIISSVQRNGYPIDILSREDYVKSSGLSLENIEPEILERVGDLIIIAQENYAIASVQDKKYPITMVGQHGGVTQQEVEIPFLSKQ